MRGNFLHFLTFFIGVLLWRWLLKFKRWQRRIHSMGLGFWLQWYNPFLLGLASVVILSFWEVIYRASLREQCELPRWLKELNMFCNILGLLAFVIAGFNIFSKLIKETHETALQDSSMREIEYMLPPRVNWLLLVVMAPMVFVAMTMHASSSLWTVLTGSGGLYDQPLTEVQEMAFYDQSLAFAELFQFTSVYAFARICQSFLSQRLEEASAPPRGEKAESLQTIAKQYRTLIRLAGFLGVWAYIAVGVVQCTITVVFTGLQLSEISTSNELKDTLFTNLIMYTRSSPLLQS